MSQFAASSGEGSARPAGGPVPVSGGPVPGLGGPSGAQIAAVLVAVLVGIWTVVVTAGLQAGVWLVEQFLAIEELATPAWAWPVAGWVNALLVGVPALLLATVPRPTTAAGTAVRAIGRLWTLGAALLAVFGTLRAVPEQHNTLYLLLLTLTGIAAWLTMRRAYRPMSHAYARYRPALPGGDATQYGVAAGLASLAAWLWLGALGGALETVFAVTASAALGLLAARALAAPFWLNFTGSRVRLVLVGGLAAGVFLVLLAAGTGASGVQLGELAVLPPLGFAAAGLARGWSGPRNPRQPGPGGSGRRKTAATPGGEAGAPPRPGALRDPALAARPGRTGTAIAAMVALAAFGPLGFVEPVQTGLEINAGSRDVGYWGLLAAGCALVVGLLSGGGYGLLLRGTGRRLVGAATVAMVAAAGLVGYVTIGSPGLHGDHLFVVMRAQADLSGLSAVADPVARRREAYRQLVDTANRTQAGLRHDLSSWHLSYTPYYLVNGVEVDGGPATRAWLSTRSDVDRVLLAPRLRPVPGRGAPIGSDSPAPDGPQWNVKMVRADQVWLTGDRGQGIVIGTSDTGVDAGHPALAGSLRDGDDSWYDPWNGTATPTDHNGHGTHTLGTALGRNGIGIAPAAQWIGCVDLDRNLGNPALYLRCLQFMLAPFPRGGDPLHDGRPSRGAQVLTNSWGCPGVEGCDRASLRPAVDALTAAGIFVVAAAGNAGPRCGSITDPPAPYPATLTVGAVDRTGTVADFSSRGPVPGAGKPDLLAPGAGVVSAVPGGGYAALSGASMAAPHVAGVVALMWAANPRLVGDVARTRQILRQTASGAVPDGCGDDAGVVDAYAAVRSATGSA